ncbi:MAG: hypothetical protein H0X28_05655 [Solirubrobacterales bacterium]|nr:hypothetical protein [Solirubrobacterales bacterium]
MLLETHVRFARKGGSSDRMADAEAAFNLSLLLETIGDEQEALALREQSIAWALAAGVDGQALTNLRSTLVGLLMQNDRPERLRRSFRSWSPPRRPEAFVARSPR